MSRARTVVLAFMAIVQTMFAQPRPDSTPEPNIVFYEAVNLATSDPTVSRVDIHYRVAEGFFVAIRNDERVDSSPFKRRGEVLIELIDSTGVSRARDIDRLEFGAATSEREFGPLRWRQAMVSFSVPPGTYTIAFEIDDLESDRRFVQRERRVEAKNFGLPQIQSSTPFFVRGPISGTSFPQSITPMNHGADLLYTTEAGMFVQLAFPTTVSPIARVELSINAWNEETDNQVVVQSDTSAHIIVMENPVLDLREDMDSIRYSITSLPTGNSVGILVPLKAAELALRRYELTARIVHASGSTDVRLPFRIVWPEMPFSLRDIELALAALRFITKPDQLDSLANGTFEQQRDKLEQFWKEKDGTPETMVNEVMTEYYRRVDHAMRTFGTLKEPDGLRSDRGRVYVLHGMPTRTERILDPGMGFQEVWIYERLSKKFIFADQNKSGNYVLVSSQSL